MDSNKVYDMVKEYLQAGYPGLLQDYQLEQIARDTLNFMLRLVHEQYTNKMRYKTREKGA
jgi:hypothetical protein